MTSRGPATAGSFAGTFAIIFAAIAGLWLFDSFLERMDRSETQAEARRSFGEGQAMAAVGRNAEAAERFKSAVAIERGNRDYQLALANTLLAVGKTAGAETVVNDLLLHDSTDGAANLTMARINVREGDVADAGSYYHRAIYGRWPVDPAEHRTEVRLELIDFLARQDVARQNARQELLAELLAVEDQVSDINTEKRLARLLLKAGSPERSAELFQAIIRKQPDSDAYAGLGDGELELGNYRQARTDFETAIKLNRSDATARERLALTDEVLGLDPAARGLGTAERYRRSALLLKLALDDLNGCVGSTRAPEIAELIDKSGKALKNRVRPSEADDAAEDNMDLALEIWKARGVTCRPVTDSEQPLALVLAELSR